MASYKIKPIEWRELQDYYKNTYYSDWTTNGGFKIQAMPVGAYNPKPIQLDYCFIEHEDEGREFFDTVEDAKAWAKNLWENRILQFLIETDESQELEYLNRKHDASYADRK